MRIGRRSPLLLLLLVVAACDCGGGGGLRRVDATLSIDPPVIDFGALSEGERATDRARLSNLGAAELTLSAGTEAPFSIGAAPERLSPGETVELDVRFEGGAAGDHEGKIVLMHDAEGPVEILLRARVVPSEDGCEASVDPEAIVFAGFDTEDVEVANFGDGDCSVDRVELVGDGFEIDADVPFIVAPDDYEAIEVTHLGDANATAVLRIWIGTTIHEVDLSATAQTGGRQLCVAPLAINFGLGNTDPRDISLEACGDLDVTINRIDWTTAAAEISLETAPSLPLVIAAGDSADLRVRYTPVDELADRAVLNIRSDAEAQPSIDVVVTSSPEVVPEDAGRFLYYWRVQTDETSDIMKLPLQGGAPAQPFWGESTGHGCPGCHQVSPDGRYVAVVELSDDATEAYVVDTMSNTRLPLVAEASSALYLTWRPDPAAAPAHRYAFSAGGRIHLAALFDGYLGELPGADQSGAGQSMPTWGSDGRIAFVAGELDEEGFGFYGATDIYVIPETGGTATPLPGASANGSANYYPAFSPDARWIAYTESRAADETESAPDARVRLVRSTGAGSVLSLDLLNGMDGATSFPSWSIDGTHLAVSSNRAGGAGDYDLYLAPIDPSTGADGPPVNLLEANTSGFEHAAQWSR